MSIGSQAWQASEPPHSQRWQNNRRIRLDSKTERRNGYADADEGTERQDASAEIRMPEAIISFVSEGPQPVFMAVSPLFSPECRPPLRPSASLRGFLCRAGEHSRFRLPCRGRR